MENDTRTAMKQEIFVVGDHILSPLGKGSAHHFGQLLSGKRAMAQTHDPTLSDHPLVIARINEDQWADSLADARRYTRLERLFILALQELISQYDIPLSSRTLVVLATTKGNIGLLHRPDAGFPQERVNLSVMAGAIQYHLGFESRFLVLSNACISGALAISVAHQLLQHDDRYDQAIVVGGDELSRFIVSGFEAFQALASEPCRPFDRDRKGLNLGEAIAAVYLSKVPSHKAIRILGVGSYNDANHISGPSRTGEGLYRSIGHALSAAGRPSLDFISAHGTATAYNDEMEAIAFHRCGVGEVPTHSLKGYFGHTLGASGLLETILGIHSLHNNRLIPSIGFREQGTTETLNIITKSISAPLRTFLKTASGFGGCNIASVFQNV